MTRRTWRHGWPVATALLLTLAACGGGSGGDSGDDAAATTTTTEVKATPDQYASVIAQQQEGLQAVETFRSDCGFSPDPDCDVDLAIAEVWIAAGTVFEEFDEIGEPNAEAEDLVDRTMLWAAEMYQARLELGECYVDYPPADEGDIPDECQAEFDKQTAQINEVTDLLLAWSPYL